MTEQASHRGMVLVVDDERPNRELLARLLTRRGYTVESVGDGEAALAAVEERRPDVVLLDVQLPCPRSSWSTMKRPFAKWLVAFSRERAIT